MTRILKLKESANGSRECNLLTKLCALKRQTRWLTSQFCGALAPFGLGKLAEGKLGGYFSGVAGGELTDDPALLPQLLARMKVGPSA